MQHDEAVRFEREILDRTSRLGRRLEQIDPVLAGFFDSLANEAECHLKWLEAVRRVPEAATPDCRPVTTNRARRCCRP